MRRDRSDHHQRNFHQGRNYTQLNEDTTALGFQNSMKIPDICCFGDIHILQNEVSALKGGDVLEIFSDTPNMKVLFLMKLAIILVLPPFVINQDSASNEKVNLIGFKELDEYPVDILVFDNSRSFRHQVFVEYLEKYIHFVICLHLGVEDVPSEQVYEIFGGNEKYQEFIVKCVCKIHIKRSRSLKDFLYSVELFSISKNKARVVMLDSFYTFWNDNDEKEWLQAMQKLRALVEKKKVNLFFSRTHKWRRKGKETYVTGEQILSYPSKLLSILDKGPLYQKTFGRNDNFVTYRIVVFQLEKEKTHYYAIVEKTKRTQFRLSPLYRISEDPLRMIYFESSKNKN